MATITITSGSWAVDATLTIGVGVPGVGVPAGGTTGQVLKKASATSYDTVWGTDQAGIWGGITGTLTDQTDLTAYVAAQLAGGTAVAKELEIEVRNQTGSTLAAGAIVYINGATGNKPTVTKAIATGDPTSAQTLGFVKASIANNATGKVVVRGLLENIDTSALTEGQQLYLSGTVAGAWQTTKPVAPVHLVYVGIVTRAHPTLGSIEVAITNGFELEELHNVLIVTPTNGQVLKYDAATSLWKNQADTTGVAWGAITGTLSAQTDLNSALAAKYDATNPAGYITSSALSGYLLSSTAAATYYPLTNPDGYITSSALSPYLLSSTAASTYQTQAGMSSYLTISSAAATYYPLTNPSGYITSAALTQYAPLAGATFTGKVNLPTRIAGGIAYLNLGPVADNVTVPTTLVEGDVFFHDTDATSGYNVRLAYTAKSFGGSLVNYSVAVLQNQNFFTQPNTISCTHNSQAALRITQLGTGEAFRVEDSTTPDATAFVISNSGRVGVGVAPDASAAIKVDVGGVMFNDGTTQTTAAGLAWTEAQVNTYALGAAFASVSNSWAAGATSSPDTMSVSFTFPNAYVLSEMLIQAGISVRIYGLEISGSYDTFDQGISLNGSGSVTATQSTSTYLNGRTYDIYLQFTPNSPAGSPVQFYVGQYVVA